MSELVPCGATGCVFGMITIPKPYVDAEGRPVIIQEVTTCAVCGGNGMVER